MAKFKADIKFRGIEEDKTFEKDEEFEMAIERAKELESNVRKKFPHIKKVMTLILEEEELKEEKEEKNKKRPKKE